MKNLFSVGGHTDDRIMFQYNTDTPKLYLTSLLSPVYISTYFFIGPCDTGNSIVKFNISNNEHLQFNSAMSRDALEIDLQGPICQKEKFAAQMRAKGHGIKSLASVIANSIRMGAAASGNVFLHAEGLVNENEKQFYIIASSDHGAGKTSLSTAMLSECADLKLLSTSLRLLVSDKNCDAYPQNYGGENSVYTYMRKSNAEQFNSISGTSLQELGFREVNDFQLEQAYSLYKTAGADYKISLKDYDVKCLFVEGVSASLQGNVIIPLSKNKTASWLDAAWLPMCKFDRRSLYNTLDMSKFDRLVDIFYNRHAQKYIEKISKYIDSTWRVRGNPFKIYEKLNH